MIERAGVHVGDVITNDRHSANSVSSHALNLEADVFMPDHANGLVLFAHGSGSSRHSPRNLYVADVLNRGSIGTILIDLLTQEEEVIDIQTAELRFDIPLLGRRVTTGDDYPAPPDGENAGGDTNSTGAPLFFF